jgi:hypothetical protein
MRITWRLPVLLLLLNKCHGDAATPAQAHVLNWAIRSKEGQLAFIRAYQGNPRLEDVIQRFDPTLDRALNFAVGCGLVQWTPSGRLRLSETGLRLLGEIKTVPIFEDEKRFLETIPGKFSQTRLDSMVRLV